MVTDILLARPLEADIHQLHRLVYATLAGPGEARRFIYADLSGVVLARGEFPPQIAALGSPMPNPEEGKEYDFTLKAQPTVKFNGKNRSIGLSPDKDSLRHRWLARCGDANGFEPVGKPLMTTRNVKIRSSRSGEFGINITSYDGRLRVTNAVLFRRALEQGVGRCRTYGCGLIILSR